MLASFGLVQLPWRAGSKFLHTTACCRRHACCKSRGVTKVSQGGGQEGLDSRVSESNGRESRGANQERGWCDAVQLLDNVAL